MSLYIMGLATIDLHSQKEHTDIHKILKFGVNQAGFNEIQRFENFKIYKEIVSPSGRFVGQRPDGHTFLGKF